MPTTEQRLENLRAASADLPQARTILVQLKRATQSAIDRVDTAQAAAATTLSNPDPEPGERAAVSLYQALEDIDLAVQALNAAQQGESGQRLDAVIAGIPEPPQPEEPEPDPE